MEQSWEQDRKQLLVAIEHEMHALADRQHNLLAEAEEERDDFDQQVEELRAKHDAQLELIDQEEKQLDE